MCFICLSALKSQFRICLSVCNGSKMAALRTACNLSRETSKGRLVICLLQANEGHATVEKREHHSISGNKSTKNRKGKNLSLEINFSHTFSRLRFQCQMLLKFHNTRFAAKCIGNTFFVFFPNDWTWSVIVLSEKNPYYKWISDRKCLLNLGSVVNIQKVLCSSILPYFKVL